ncbi:pantoate--beta-alanine ligase [Haloferula sp. A504]|uniref:pantoate--beta-alanine ligase n=1 Tax=Haloferula sp. A504 TaxID=3373601 RepID=UPI0031C2B0A5|nr:pantoate--beta-alanine ligase [Verrucomicrobiaceae bacterium E54]
MRVVTDPAELRRPSPSPVVLVPTMGALHEGHLALIRRAREAAGADGTVAVSIFVNPIQFDRAEDLAAYPRPLDDDLAKCRAAAVDLVFAPEQRAVYFPDRSITVLETSLSKTLCGATRPGHFDGVCTVVLKLFNLIRPDAAVFGEKDYQQLAIIRRLVRDLDVPVEILSHPTVREPDGLAMSSRNARLDPAQRTDAPRIHRALVEASEKHDPASILATARTGIESPISRIDYLELVDAETLQPAIDLSRPTRLAAAVFYGDVRLIDNVLVFPVLPLMTALKTVDAHKKYEVGLLGVLISLAGGSLFVIGFPERKTWDPALFAFEGRNQCAFAFTDETHAAEWVSPLRKHGLGLFRMPIQEIFEDLIHLDQPLGLTVNPASEESFDFEAAKLAHFQQLIQELCGRAESSSEDAS